jgi:angiomotin like
MYIIFLELNIYEKVSSTPPVKMRYSSASNDSTSQQNRYSNTSGNRSVSVSDNNGNSQRNSLILQQQQSNRNSLDHPQSNRSSMDVSQSSYNTLIIHDNNESQPLFSGPSNSANLMKHDLYFINSSPSPPNYVVKKDKSASRSFHNYAGHTQVNDSNTMSPITENEQQYLNQSYVLKHLAKEVKMPKSSTVNDSTRDSGVSENNSSSNNQNWSNDSANGGRNKSKSQPDLTKLAEANSNQEPGNNSATNTLNFNDFEQLEVENKKLREQLNDCLMKVAKSQKVSTMSNYT